MAAVFGGVFLLVALSLLLFAPSGLGVLALPFGFTKHEYWNSHLGEFRPFSMQLETALQWSWIALSLGAAGWSFRTRNLFAGMMCLGFGLLAVRHARMISPLAVAVLAVLPSISFPRVRPIPRAFLVAGGLALCFTGVSAHFERVPFGLTDSGFNEDRHPMNLYERAREVPGETFVSDGLAGMWLWQVYRSDAPEAEQKRVLIHNCLECYEETTYKDVYQTLRRKPCVEKGV